MHLGSGDTATHHLFSSFLTSLPASAGTLVILGDLFDVWVGDDAATHTELSIASEINQVASRGIEVIFVRGNRDFLLGQDFCDRAGMRLVDEPIILSTITPATALIHGDILCTDDMAYQRFREKSRSSAWQRKVLRLPIWLRRRLGQWARWRSQYHQRSPAHDKKTITDANPDAVTRLMRQHNISRLIHGHTHRQNIHREPQYQNERWVLGDWHEGRGSVIVITDDGTTMHRLSLDDTLGVNWSAPWPLPGH